MADDETYDMLPDEDLGEPIAELADLTVAAPSHLMTRVRGSIFRRSFAGDVTRFATWGPLTTLLELLRAVFESLRGTAPPTQTDGTDEQ